MVQAYCQLHSVGQLSTENTMIWVDHTFKFSKDGGMKKKQLKLLEKPLKNNFQNVKFN